MTTTHSNLALVDGEVYILGDNVFGFYDGFKNKEAAIEKYDECFVYVKYNKICPVLTSTAKLEGIPKLDRKHFVKPKVDVEELAWQKSQEDSRYLDLSSNFEKGFISGYNAKEAEFTREDMEKLWIYAISDKLNYEQAMELIQPLSLPKSVTLNEKNELISVEW